MTAVWVIVILVGLYFLHRIALWAESRGYIFYVKKKASGNALGNALLEAQSLIEPNKHELVQVLRDERSEQAESGEPPEPFGTGSAPGSLE